MTQDHRPKFNQQISEEAAEWLVEFRLGDIDATGRREFDTWIRSSPEHLRAYLEIAAIWNKGASLGARADLSSDALIALARAEGNVILLDRAPREDSGTCLSKASSPITGAGHRRSSLILAGESSESAAPVPSAKHISRGRSWSLAAALTAVIVGAALLSWYLERGSVYATMVGERRSLRLQDGSSVELNSRSRIRVRFSKSERDVELVEGQALFHVEKDVARPFVVRSEAVRVRAVGTQFDVNRMTAGTTVTVVEGRVAVYEESAFSSLRAPEPSNLKSPPSLRGSTTEKAPVQLQGEGTGAPVAAAIKGLTSAEGREPAGQAGSSAIYLSAGEQLTVNDQAASLPHHTSTSAATAWTQGELVFESALLTDVTEEFNRYSERRLTVEDHGANPLRLSGVFTTDCRFLIQYLRHRPDITVEETATEVRIIRHD
jgi:transmembrane sensor